MGRSDVDLRDDEYRDRDEDVRRDDTRRGAYRTDENRDEYRNREVARNRDDDFRDHDRDRDYRDRNYGGRTTGRGVARESHRSPETKTFLASSEFWITVGAVVALFIGGYALNDITNSDAWKWATWIAIAYIVSRGIAKAGSQRMSETVSQAPPMRDQGPPRV
jgi:hypothetical protein